MPSVEPPKLDGLNTITTANDTIGVRSPAGAAPVSQNVAAGDWFIHSHTGVPADGAQLIERFDTAVELTHGVGNLIVTVSNTTGQVTIRNSHAANTLQIDWTDTPLRDLLGFTGPNTGVIAANGGTVTGANPHLNGWYPDVPPVDLIGDPSLVGIRRSDAAVTVAPSGRVVTTKFFEHVLQILYFRGLARSGCLPLDATISNFEQFWQRILSAGIRFRYYPDRTDRDGPGGAGPFTYVADERLAREGSMLLERETAFWRERYNLDMPLRQYVA